jgi:NodT family efflux transporter outer membrane factor (OMF) lipoprotein
MAAEVTYEPTNDVRLKRPTVRRKALGLVMLLMPILGCQVGPDYCPPSVLLHDCWHMEESCVCVPGVSGLHSWWLEFHDPVLEGLIRTSLEQNLDLREACFRILQARSRAGVVRGDLFPIAGPTAGLSRRQLSRNGDALGAAFDSSNSLAFEPYSLHGVGLDMVWEIDLFGKYRRLLEAANAEACAAVEDYHGTTTLLLAEVASTYTQMRMWEERLNVAEDNLAMLKQTKSLCESRHRAGVVGEFDVRRAEADVHAAAAIIPTMQAAWQENRNRLCILLGLPPRDMSHVLGPRGVIPFANDGIPAGVPADLLRCRPDVRQAECEVHARCAEIGAATAELLPELTIRGTIGLDSRDVATWFATNSLAHSIGPAVKWNILNFGRVSHRIDETEARFCEAVTTYQKTVLKAAEEAENALAAYVHERDREQHLARAAAAGQHAVRLAEAEYREGAQPFIGLVDAQRAWHTLREQQVTSRAHITLNRIKIYRSLGGGWQVPPPAACETVEEAPQQ